MVKCDSGSVRNRMAMVIAGTLPLVLGIGLALLTGSWMFLAFSAMGAVTVLIPLVGSSKRRKAFRAAVSAAVGHDWQRRASTFPDAASLLLATRSNADNPPGWPPVAARPSSGLAIRLGTGTQAAALSVAPDDASFIPPELPSLPLASLLGYVPTTISGPSTPVLALLNFVLMQLDAARVPVVLLGPADAIPLAARFLPHTVLVSSAAAASSAIARHLLRADETILGVVLVAVNEPVSSLVAFMPGLRAIHFSLRRPNPPESSSNESVPLATNPSGSMRAGTSAANGVIDATNTPGGTATTMVTLWAAGNQILGTFNGLGFVPDGVPAAVFDDYARRRAVQSSVSTSSEAAPARTMHFNTLPLPEKSSISAIVHEWHQNNRGPLRPVQLGVSATGPVMFDFLRDGPHLLIGGTTGSGKSEILRTLVGSLAAAHSPADLQFVLIDFKGGAGLGVMAKLPHTTSLITDLGGHGMDRTLTSLRAEIRRRESALASVEATDSQAFRKMIGPSGPSPGCHSMTHLIIVVDEFRVLVDQFPDAMAELMRIAAVGRSLGIHLVLATQRPQGAVNADIRANVTSSICLRVQSAFDSTDVIGTGVAENISVGTPGRAFFSRAGSPPEEFQSATLRLPPKAEELVPTVELTTERLTGELTADVLKDFLESDATAVANLLSQSWRNPASCGLSPSAPAVVAPELPAEGELLGNTSVNGEAGGNAAGEVRLGTVDVPQEQCLRPLRWNPGAHSHIALFGTPPETANAMALLARQLLSANAESARLSPRLLYLLDGDGSLKISSISEFVGAYLTPEDLRPAAHLVQRLAETVRSHPDRSFVLGISDWGRWATAFRSSPWHDAEDAVAELIRFGQENLAVMISGARELITAPFLASIPNRIYLTHGSSTESTMLWPRLPHFTPVPGRAAIAGPIDAQLASGQHQSHQSAPRQSLAGQADSGAMHVAQLGRLDLAVTANPTMAGSRAEGVLRVRPLARSLTMTQLQEFMKCGPHPPTGQTPETSAAPGRNRPPSLLVGLGGDGEQLVRIAVTAGTVLPVVGLPGSGKSCFLQAMEILNGHELASGEGEPAQIVYLDDATAAPDPVLDRATRALASGAVLVAAFPYPGPGLSTLPLEWGLRAAQQGIVLAPQRPADADLFGVRLDTMGAEPPGRGVLLNRGSRVWFQFPLT
ncbi:hypothetical protein MB46_11560 [Arthrobacter alpinus]|uniref:FtsK/SpoIIIE domain-containing protein n=1 Tax=Arthrobacter alpinus TaxID=656366 RepID=UPI0005CADD57|nr:FtsK/SpoIIIE domain-containing protein [Arthrobacter alpinus]ALV46026.1 hypothetical protein MB46_11560 [Arthrobacter alpinus]